jgi:hypothetical protein
MKVTAVFNCTRCGKSEKKVKHATDFLVEHPVFYVALVPGLRRTTGCVPLESSSEVMQDGYQLRTSRDAVQRFRYSTTHAPVKKPCDDFKAGVRGDARLIATSHLT